MEDDPTIDHNEVIVVHETWHAEHKRFHQVTIGADNPQHVFDGDMTAPHRIDWAVEVCSDFLESIAPASAGEKEYSQLADARRMDNRLGGRP